MTEIAGTTRDIIEEEINLSGITLKLVDTAGIHDTPDLVESIGVEKAKKIAAEADLILYVVDSSSELDDNDYRIFDIIKDIRTIVLLNKSDLATVTGEQDIGKLTKAPVISISARERTGIETLSDCIVEMFAKGDIEYNDEVYISGERNREALMNARESLLMVKQGIEDKMPEDLYTIDMMNAYEELGKITGESVEEDLVNEIFSKFCMGK